LQLTGLQLRLVGEVVLVEFLRSLLGFLVVDGVGAGYKYRVSALYASRYTPGGGGVSHFLLLKASWRFRLCSL
jgi:hypothetical protein